MREPLRRKRVMQAGSRNLSRLRVRNAHHDLAL